MACTFTLFEAILDSSELLDELIRNWDTTLPVTLQYDHLNATAQEDITRRVNQFYFGNPATPTNQLDQQALVDVSTKCYK